MVTSFAVVVVLTIASSVNSYPQFQLQIPNGDKVPNPCDRSTTWMGVGHQNLMGGGTLNPFGNDFKANNFTFNETVCEKDSDGDGYSNGYELGDPNCTWSPGQTPYSSTNLTHPGICEPLDSTTCADKNSWLTNCSNTKFDCPAINDHDVNSYTMRFPPSPVPANVTTYMCNRFLYPNDSIADIIAIVPVIDNLEIVHHMILYGCYDEPIDLPNNGPFVCGMGGGSCKALLDVWGFGSVGQCLNSQLGFRIGPGGFQYANLQIHWNNPQRKANLTDSSGMMIYYTTKLRPNRGEVLGVSQNYLNIPPGKSDTTYYGNCSSLCTKSQTNQSLYITSAYFHMHYLGRSGNAGLYRNGELLQMLGQVDHYDYNSPKLIEFETPIELKPEDSILLKCVFDSTGKNTTTQFGEETSDEMCMVFFAYYPQIKDFNICIQFKSVNICTKKHILSSEQCDLPTFLKYSAALPTLCSSDCLNSSCVGALNAALATGCQRSDDVRSFLQVFTPTIGFVLADCYLAQSVNTVYSTKGTTQIGSVNTVYSTQGTTQIGSVNTVYSTQGTTQIGLHTKASHCPPLRSFYSDSVLLLVVYSRHLF